MKVLSTILLTLLGTMGLYAQQTVASSGGDISGDGSVSFTVGQMVYLSHTDGDTKVEEGVQHSYESITLNVDEIDASLALDVYPNPTASILTLKASDLNGEKLQYKLSNIQGRAIMNSSKEFMNKTDIDMSSLPVGVYLLSVSSKSDLKTYRIVKK